MTTTGPIMVRMQGNSDDKTPRIPADAGVVANTNADVDANADAADAAAQAAQEAYDSGRFDTAVALRNEEIQLRESMQGPDHLDVAAALEGLSLALQDQGELTAAAEPLSRALSIREQQLGSDHVLTAESLNDTARLHWLKGELGAARGFLQRAVRIWRDQLGDHLSTATGLHNLGRLQHDLGAYRYAEQLYRGALAIRAQQLGPNATPVVWTTCFLGRVLFDIGHPEAPELLRKAVNLAQPLEEEDPFVLLHAKSNLAAHLVQGLQYEEAIDIYQQIVERCRKVLGPDHPDVATFLLQMGHAQRFAGRLVDAELSLTESRRIREAKLGAGHAELAYCDAAMARLYAAQKQTETADRLFEAAASRIEAWSANHPLAVESRTLAGLMWMECGEFELAEKRLSHAASGFEAARRKVRHGTERTTFMAEPYSALAISLLELGREDVWAQVDKAQGRALREIIFRVDEAEPDAVVTMDGIRDALDARTVVVGWIEPRRGESFPAWGYVIDSDDVRWVRLPNFQPERARQSVEVLADELARAGRSSLRAPRPDAHRTQTEEVWRTWFEPLEPWLEDADHWVVVSSGVLAGFPVECLSDRGGSVVGLKRLVSYMPSAATYAKLASERNRTKKPSRALLLGDPPFGEAVPQLPATRREVEMITPLFDDVRVLLGEDAAEARIEDMRTGGELEQFDVLHFATHAIADPERPERSALLLSQQDLPDPVDAALDETRFFSGEITAGEVSRNWKLNALVVTLSACETGRGRHVHGEGVVGFAQAFLRAGATHLLVSCWDVDDEATRIFMETFYGEFLRPNESPDLLPALQSARRRLVEYERDGRHPYSHPCYWSAFILYGG